MLTNHSLVAFLATSQPDRAKAFYTETLGLRLITDDHFSQAYDAGGSPIRVQKVASFTPHPFTSLGWEVDDILGVVAGLAARGVTFERYPFLQQDELGIWGGPSVAWFKDPDGKSAMELG